ncbi:YfhD family protein [Sporosarcina sp. UB5]|uniref:YfhD family protein n=1 Tax=Sporosarcina sp. UB5 TaxID=3047463 RepID=UPI003D7A3271
MCPIQHKTTTKSHSMGDSKLKGATVMGRDEHKTGGNNTRSLPQTPKKQKIKPSEVKEEIAKEFAELRKAKKKKQL